MFAVEGGPQVDVIEREICPRNLLLQKRPLGIIGVGFQHGRLSSATLKLQKCVCPMRLSLVTARLNSGEPSRMAMSSIRPALFGRH